MAVDEVVDRHVEVHVQRVAEPACVRSFLLHAAGLRDVLAGVGLSDLHEDAELSAHALYGAVSMAALSRVHSRRLHRR